MPNSAIIHAACFAVGAVVGGSVIAVTTRRQIPLPPTTDTKTVIELGPGGTAKFLGSSAANELGGTVLKYGNPGPISDLLVRRAYVAAYDRRLRHPAWTAEHLTLGTLGRSGGEGSSPGSGDRSKSAFKEDESLPVAFRARLQDYFRSGYDRGHMVPAADAKITQEAMDETFLLSNIAPQVGAGFNRHYWAYLEDWCRRLTGSFADVYVFTIPLYLPRLEADGKWRVTHEVIGSPPNVAVPTHFAKVVLATRPSSPSTPDIPEISTGAFVLPNTIIPDDAPLQSFVMPVDAVERAAGLTLFSDAVKASSKHLCKSTKCDVVVRRFDDAQKKPEMRRAISAPR
ncbi:hypothetical protein BJ138DRAFT_1067560 [Hygrophoropsis aurantiaca]|uniref:Uncharacterized protein n=1 Tax=Hygrophoropsis aurantiaca TaxID=72124 RepID=A0ACB8A6P8_9AGAM|nr:hypothetical protein BJ138DRAFT_1067560 [Hygrophoropsis aurantiaca]